MAAFFALSAFAAALNPCRAQAYHEATGSYFPTLSPPKSLLVAKTWSGPGAAPIALSGQSEVSRAEFILLESLAGVLL